MGDDNGTEQQQDKTFTVQLQWTPNTGRLAVAVGDEPIELVVLLNLLKAAVQEVEADWRIQKGLAAQSMVKQQAEDAARTKAILDKVTPLRKLQ